MALTGDLSTIVIGDVLSWAAARRKSGTVEVTRRSTRKKLVLRAGRIQSSWSNDPRETLGQALIRERLLDEQQLFEALLEQEKSRQKLGAILVGRGVLVEAELVRILRWKAEEIVYDLFLWADGRFEFQDASAKDEVYPVSIDLEIGSVVREGTTRAEEWARIQKVFPSSGVTFKVTRAAFGAEDPVERQVLGLAAAGKTLAAISLETRRSQFETARVLMALRGRGAVEAAPVADDGASSDPVGAIDLLLKAAAQGVADKRFDSALEAYERVLGIDALNQEAKKGLVALAEARRQAKILKRVPLDKVPTLRMGSVALSHERFDSHEGFVLSRINGQWDIRSILKLCPMPEEEALGIFVRLLDRKVIDL
jgi:hypothetical protein